MVGVNEGEGEGRGRNSCILIKRNNNIKLNIRMSSKKLADCRLCSMLLCLTTQQLG